MRALVTVLIVAALVVASAVAQAQPSADADRREQARVLFVSGLAHFDHAEWSAALADFLRSRELFPTRTNTMNAAVCLRKEGRFDEALDLLEEILRTYPDLAPNERSFAENEIAELRRSVGSIDLVASEPGASIVIDGRSRGVFPLSAPLRAPAGARLVRVYKDGFVPFERRVDLASRQVLTLEAKLARLTVGGRLIVTEASAAALDVLVDDVVVGKTPFEATLAAGRHTVSLRGPGDLGTPPVDATITKDDVTRLNLSAEALDASLRVAPTPATALVSIDGVIVGHGVWEGRLRSGAHKIELAAEGFLPQTREPVLTKGERSSLDVALERDVTSGAFRASNPGRFFAELAAGPGAAIAFGGDVRAGCTGACSAQIPLALGATLRGGYQLSRGIIFGLDAGFLAISAGTTARTTPLQPRGLAAQRGTTDDDLYFRGFRIGPSFGYRFGAPFIVTVRLGAGAFVGSAGDNRSGRFTTSGGAPFEVAVSESSRATYLYAAPEIRISTVVASRLEASLGLEALVLVALDRPTWSDAQPVVAAPPGQSGDGVATFGNQTLAGAFVATLVPSLGVRYAF